MTYDSFHDTAIHFGLFTTENKGHYILIEANASFCTPYALRFLFARMVLEGYPTLPLWEEFKLALAQDFIISTRSQEHGIDCTLKAISSNVHDGGRSLSHFGLPEPFFCSPEVVTVSRTDSACLVFTGYHVDTLPACIHMGNTKNTKSRCSGAAEQRPDAADGAGNPSDGAQRRLVSDQDDRTINLTLKGCPPKDRTPRNPPANQIWPHCHPILQTPIHPSISPILA